MKRERYLTFTDHHNLHQMVRNPPPPPLPAPQKKGYVWSCTCNWVKISLFAETVPQCNSTQHRPSLRRNRVMGNVVLQWLAIPLTCHWSSWAAQQSEKNAVVPRDHHTSSPRSDPQIPASHPRVSSLGEKEGPHRPLHAEWFLKKLSHARVYWRPIVLCQKKIKNSRRPQW